MFESLLHIAISVPQVKEYEAVIKNQGRLVFSRRKGLHQIQGRL